MKKILLFELFSIILIGCATLSTSKMIETTKTEGIKHIFNHPYKKVFYACEDVLTERGGGPWGTWKIKESNIESGIIRGEWALGRKMIILVKKLEDEKILVKMQKFGVVFGSYVNFFEEVERLARRDYSE